MVKAAGLLNRRKQVRTPVALLCSLSNKYSWKRYERSFPPSYEVNSITAVLLEG